MLVIPQPYYLIFVLHHNKCNFHHQTLLVYRLPYKLIEYNLYGSRVHHQDALKHLAKVPQVESVVGLGGRRQQLLHQRHEYFNGTIQKRLLANLNVVEIPRPGTEYHAKDCILK